MGSFSIWHWLILALMCLGIYGLYRFVKRLNAARAADGSSASGVGGWLMLLVIGLMFLGPLMGAGRLNSEIMSAEAQYPNLRTMTDWQTFKAMTWWTYLVVAGTSFYGGLGLAKGRDPTVVLRAKLVLWIIGPLATIVMAVLIPLAVFGRLDGGEELFKALTSSLLTALIWTLYLSKSKRVAATYGLDQRPGAAVTA